jgi:hypothetical protein
MQDRSYYNRGRLLDGDAHHCKVVERTARAVRVLYWIRTRITALLLKVFDAALKACTTILYRPGVRPAAAAFTRRL